MDEETYENPPYYIGDGVYAKNNQDGSFTLFTDRMESRHYIVFGENEWRNVERFAKGVFG